MFVIVQTAGANPDHVDPALLAGAAGQPQFAAGGGSVSGFEVGGDQGLLASASNGSLAAAGQNGFIPDGVQYAAYGNAAANGAGQASGEQQSSFAYQQASYSNGSTVEGQQYAG